MGQIFHAAAYDLETKTCCVMDADKFHANCYSYSGVVKSIHYLLRQKAYNVIWGGSEVVVDNYLENVTDNSVLLGLSTYENLEHFEMNDENLTERSYYDKVKFIEAYGKLWNRISVWNEAIILFGDGIKYSGFLLNHTQKLAVSLADFYEQSKSIKTVSGEVYEFVIDAVSVLTETGGGAGMAFFDGISAETTENLAGSWCGNLLQITDDLPDGYSVINCCFADVWERVEYLRQIHGTNENGFVLNGADGKLYRATRRHFQEAGLLYNVMVTTDENFEVPEARILWGIKAKKTERFRYIPIPLI
jgi:hypothetical protein